MHASASSRRCKIRSGSNHSRGGCALSRGSGEPARPSPQRSAIMRAVSRSKTTPELRVAKVLRLLGCSYCMNQKTKPGSPDFVLRNEKIAIFVHGCFWHRHRCRAGRSTPDTNRKFWVQKFQDNIKRDRRKERALRALGYRVWVIWECQTATKRRHALAKRLSRMLNQVGVRVNSGAFA
jgi:DNA mismatch endonuclease (patch repair protein)